MAPKGKTAAKAETGANLGFEADALRNNMDAAEYKHVVLGLIFLKYISDAFEAKHAELDAQTAQGADPEDPDEYRAASIFWVPQGSALVPSSSEGAAADHRHAGR
jgi:type I restriction enzyme M protein